MAETLILYCQSEQKYFPHDLGPEWFPSELVKEGHFRASVNASWAEIEFGGGFFHFGYSLRRDERASTTQTNVWELSLHSEDSEGMRLCRKSIATTRRLSAAELLKQVIAGYDALLATDPSSEVTHQGKIATLLRFDRIPEARTACKAMLEKMPDDWWANIVCALATAGEKSDEEAEQFLAAWAKRTPNFFSYLDLAYYYQLREQPKKAAAAMVKATEYDANTAWGHGGNSEFRGYSAALYAFRSGEYEASIKLCDKLLPVKINGKYAKRALRDLKAAAEKLAKGEKADFTPEEGIGDFSLFDRDIVDKLLQHTRKRPER